MDISSVQVSDTTTIDDFYDSEGAPVLDEQTGDPVTITIYGPESDEFNRLIARKARQEQIKNKGRRRTKDEPIADDAIIKQRQRAVETLADVTVSWTGFYEKGQPLECNRENAMKLYTVAPFIRARVDAALGEESRFFTISKAS